MRYPPFIASVRSGSPDSGFDFIFTAYGPPLGFIRVILYVLAPLYALYRNKSVLLIRRAVDKEVFVDTIGGTMSTIKPIADRVILLPIEENRMTKSGIVLPDSAEKERPIKGRVLAVGVGKRNDRGDVMHMSVKVGDVVLFKKYGPDEIELDGKKYLVAEESDILAIIES